MKGKGKGDAKGHRKGDDGTGRGRGRAGKSGANQPKVGPVVSDPGRQEPMTVSDVLNMLSPTSGPASQRPDGGERGNLPSHMQGQGLPESLWLPEPVLADAGVNPLGMSTSSKPPGISSPMSAGPHGFGPSTFSPEPPAEAPAASKKKKKSKAQVKTIDETLLPPKSGPPNLSIHDSTDWSESPAPSGKGLSKGEGYNYRGPPPGAETWMRPPPPDKGLGNAEGYNYRGPPPGAEPWMRPPPATGPGGPPAGYPSAYLAAAQLAQAAMHARAMQAFSATQAASSLFAHHAAMAQQAAASAQATKGKGSKGFGKGKGKASPPKAKAATATVPIHTPKAPPPAPELTEDPVQAIPNQLDFYFSAENLDKDLYLREHMEAGTGWVHLAVIAGFPRMIRLDCTPQKLYDYSSHFDHLEFSEDKIRVRIRDPVLRQHYLQKGKKGKVPKKRAGGRGAGNHGARSSPAPAPPATQEVGG